jgi:hypothetical protein
MANGCRENQCAAKRAFAADRGEGQCRHHLRKIMKSKAHRLALTAAAAATAVWYYATACGIGLTFDSHIYLFAAKHWATHGQLMAAPGQPYANWPPLFPWLLSVVAPFWLNALALFSGVYVFVRLAARYLNGLFLYAFAAGMAFSPSNLLCANFVWSESVFIALSAIFLWYLSAVIQQPNISHFTASIISANLLCMQRNAGVFFVAAAVLVLAFYWRNQQRKQIIWLAGCFVAFFGWQLRNVFFLEGIHDVRNNVLAVSYIESIYFMFYSLSDWLMPIFLPNIGKVIFAILLLGYLAKIFLPTFRSCVFEKILLSIVLIYMLSMSILRLNPEEETDRYMAVVFPVAWLLLLRLLSAENWSKKYLIYGLLAWPLLYGTARSFKNAHFWHQNRCSGVMKNGQDMLVYMAEKR